MSINKNVTEMLAQKSLPTTNCEVCGGNDFSVVFEVDNVPAQDGIMYTTRELALEAPSGDVRLRICRHCGFVINEAYESEKVQFDTYDFSLNFSPAFVQFTDNLIDRLNQTYDLKGKQVVEVGSGDGSFLKAMCKRTGAKGIGIDPGFEPPDNNTGQHLDIKFIRDYYSTNYADLEVDFLICRLVIDLLGAPMDLLKIIRQNLEGSWDTVVYFEVPNALKNFQNKVIWTFIYEHRTWFTPESIRNFFEKCGFKVLNTAPCWHDEYLGIEAVPIPMSEINQDIKLEAVHGFLKIVEEFQLHVEDIKKKSAMKLEELKNSYNRIAMWGAGARAVMFLNMYDTGDLIQKLVDVNSMRHGKFIAGSGHETISPEKLKEFNPDLIIITNPTYAEEIKAQAAGLGLSSSFWIL